MQKSNQSKVVLPGQTIGIIGGGQLGRMMAIAARYMGYKIVVLDPTPNCPTAQVADEQIVADYDDMDAIKKLTEASDVVTYEFENVDLTAATYIEKMGKLPQGAHALKITQNRQKEKELIDDLQLTVPLFKIVRGGKECDHALTNFPLPAVIKTCRGGYDGKGQLKIESSGDIKQAIEFANIHKFCLIEEWITFDKEISVVFTRSISGELEFFPVSENNHRDHILYETIVPASINNEMAEKAKKMAAIIADQMNIVGTFAIEMFIKGKEIYINEMAPRPHNSAHYTIEACNVSQFTQHIRAICGLPLIRVELLKPSLMQNVLGEDLDRVLEAMKCSSNGFLHLYGKSEVQPKRKMGHVTFIAHTTDELMQLKQDWSRENSKTT